MSTTTILGAAFLYLAILFAIATWGDRRADRGRSVIAHPLVYALSIGVYCTAWTFFGSVGRAASSGIDFLPIYLGPTLAMTLWWFAARKMLRISKTNRITSIADFVASRYGKSQLLGGLVTIVSLVVITPYIALQLKAVSAAYDFLRVGMIGERPSLEAVEDTALYVAVLMAAFAILYGTRHIDATERHEGMVAAIAFESVVKLVAFIAVGIFAVFVAFDGPFDLFARAAERPDIARLFTSTGSGGFAGWITLTALAFAAFMFLPRQFQVTVVENTDERHLATASWAVPAYLVLINIFVLPIAVAGLLQFPAGRVDSDLFVLALPLAAGADVLALFVFIGGLSAATGMVIVETIALATMLCNDLVMPILLRMRSLGLTERGDLTRLLVAIRRGAIVLVLILGYGYFHFIGGSYALVSIGLLSFSAVAQFAPAILAGLYWRGATRIGAAWGLAAGFGVWIYTLLLPSFARSGWIAMDFVESGPLGIAALKPYALFGVEFGDPHAHALFWSMLANIGLFIGLSLASEPTATERVQATRFIDAFRLDAGGVERPVWRGTTRLAELIELVARFVGRGRAEQDFAEYARERGLDLARIEHADAGFVQFAERLLAGAIGASSARVMIASTVRHESVGAEEVIAILDEASAVIEYSRQLEQKSQALERASSELRAANERLQELDRLKDEFLATVTHELRTPLTSIRSFSEILRDNADLPPEQRGEFLAIVIKESERLTRLINQVLDLAKIEADRYDWQIAAVDPRAVAEDALAATRRLFEERGVAVEIDLGVVPAVRADRDQVMQVAVNLLSNAAKFAPDRQGRVRFALRQVGGAAEFSVADNGPGIAPEHVPHVFEKFRQFTDQRAGKPQGTGLGLAICRRIVEHLGGRIAVESRPGSGAHFIFTVPLA